MGQSASRLYITDHVHRDHTERVAQLRRALERDRLRLILNLVVDSSVVMLI